MEPMMRSILMLPVILAWNLLSVSIPEGGIRVLGNNPITSFSLVGQAGKGSITVVTAEGGQLLRAETKEKVDATYGLQASAKNMVALQKGDVMLAVFRIRAVRSSSEDATVRTMFVLEKGAPPYTKSKSFSFTAGFEWSTVYVPFVMEESYGVGQARCFFAMGYAPQEFELADVDVLSFGRSVKLEDLPATQPIVSWAGRALDAPWRRAAEERIERIRKGDMHFTVKDALGNAIPAARVNVRMKRHAFGFGSAVSVRRFMAESGDGERYRAIVLSNYSRIVFENDLKWPVYESGKRSTNVNDNANHANTLAALSLLERHGIEVRGHVLVWPSFRNSPKDLAAKKDDIPAMRKRITDHIIEEVSEFKGRLVDWDVVNEVYANHDVIDIIGNGPNGFGEIAEWFTLVRSLDPKPNLYVNDYSILSSGGADTKHIEAYESLIRYLVDANAPLDGIGMQSHMASAVPPETLLAVLDRFAVFGKKISSTEFDMSNFDDIGQAEYLRDFMTALFSHPSVDGIIMWGFWENAHWLAKNGAHLYRKDWTPKPAAQMWLDLVKGKWLTEAQGMTDGLGAFSARGFFGTYDVTVTVNGRTKTFTVTHQKGTATELMME